MLDVIIIGGGILGVTTARLLSRFNLDTLVLEKGADLGEGASKANSAVLAAGFHPRGGSLKGISCVCVEMPCIPRSVKSSASKSPIRDHFSSPFTEKGRR